MRVHVTLYDKANREAARSVWITARSGFDAETKAVVWANLHRVECGVACALTSLVLSRKRAGGEQLAVYAQKEVHYGPVDGAQANPDDMAG